MSLAWKRLTRSVVTAFYSWTVNDFVFFVVFEFNASSILIDRPNIVYYLDDILDDESKTVWTENNATKKYFVVSKYIWCPHIFMRRLTFWQHKIVSKWFVDVSLSDVNNASWIHYDDLRFISESIGHSQFVRVLYTTFYVSIFKASVRMSLSTYLSFILVMVDILLQLHMYMMIIRVGERIQWFESHRRRHREAMSE